jgi:ribosomal protein S18 acetylase RimI-like enzyme
MKISETALILLNIQRVKFESVIKHNTPIKNYYWKYIFKLYKFINNLYENGCIN